MRSAVWPLSQEQISAGDFIPVEVGSAGLISEHDIVIIRDEEMERCEQEKDILTLVKVFIEFFLYCCEDMSGISRDVNTSTPSRQRKRTNLYLVIYSLRLCICKLKKFAKPHLKV